MIKAFWELVEAEQRAEHERIAAKYFNEGAKVSETQSKSEAGFRLDAGKPRWDLLPADALLELVKVYTKGAEKYTRKFVNEWEGLWELVRPTQIEVFTHADYVGVVTKNNLGRITLTTPSGKNKIVSDGNKDTAHGNENWINAANSIQHCVNETNKQNGKDIYKNSASHNKFTITTSRKDALSAVADSTFTLITTTQRNDFEEYCIVNTTTVLGSLEITLKVLREHSRISQNGDLHELPGDRNWEKGMSWHRCFRPLLSHAWKFWMGKRYDDEGPGATHCHHMAMVAWNALALCAYDLRHVGVDDRPKNEHVEKTILVAPGSMDI